MRERPVGCSERRKPPGTLEPRLDGNTETLHVFGGQRQRNHPTRGAASSQTGITLAQFVLLFFVINTDIRRNLESFIACLTHKIICHPAGLKTCVGMHH